MRYICYLIIRFRTYLYHWLLYNQSACVLYTSFIFCLFLNYHFLMTVSYTHLDVYKRQVYNSNIWTIVESCSNRPQWKVLTISTSLKSDN